MYQRKEKSERNLPSCNEDMLDLFKLLESSDPEEVESVKNMIYENLSTAKDSKLLNCIVEYYLAVQSERSLDILFRVKDPHDKHLFDKINELIKSENTCYQSLQLLCNLVYRQPSWIYKIANHRLMNSLFQLLKNDIKAPNLISALLIIVCLLPMIPVQFGHFLTDTFEVFSRLIAWNVKKPSAVSELYVLHLQVGVYSLFHRLYGMFPCNFLAYLRSYYGGREYSEENFKVFTLFIKPMLERVRLHPLLVTASKETELSVNRWKKMEYHDVITDCASISLDAIEGTLEGLGGRAQNLNTIPKRHGNFSAQSSLQFVSLSSQSSITSVTLDQGSTINDAVASHRGSLWSPSRSYSSSTMAPVVHTATLQGTVKRNPQLKDLQSQLSNEENFPLDLAVEAKPEEVNSRDVNLVQQEDDSSFKQKLMKMPSNESKSEKQCSEDKSASLTENIFKDSDKDLREMSSLEILSTSTEKQILQGVEAKEEETDKEVSELTSLQNKPLEEFSDEERLDTPFCSTTQNLTADLKNVQSCEEATTEKLTKSHDEDVDEMYNSMQDAEDENYVPPFSRYRYLSHCGPPPVIPSESVQKPKVFRSNSCPAKLCPSQSSVIPEKNSIVDSVSKTETVVATCSSSVITPSGAFAISNNVILSSASRNLTYEQLIPMAMDPLPDILSRPPNANLESNYSSCNTMFSSLSPNDLLDNYVLLGNVTYTSQQSSIPITSTKSTDWTHFGGKPPPDEVEILRNQILLLHNQLRFERHRKDVHSERIRRILGRAKKSKMQEELIIALKEQITLLVKENEELKVEVSKKTEILEQFKLEKKQTEMELNSLIKKLSLENTQLLFSNKNMQNLLVSQKEENDRIIAACKFSQEQIVNLETESNLCRQEVECCRKLKKEAEFLSKQLFLLQEVNTLYKEKIDKLKEPSSTNDIGEELYDSAASIEMNDLKMKLETTCYQLNASKCRIVELEQLINNMKQKEKDHHQIIEQLKSYQKDEIKVCEEHLAEIKRIAVEKDSFILQLFKEKEILSENLVTLEKKLSGASPIVKEPCGIIPSSEQQGTSSPAAHSSDSSRDNSRS